jgi:hypothetical protein
MARCSALKADGTPCERIVSISETFCYAHDPATADERKRTAAKAGQRGGRGRPGPRAKEIREVKTSIRQLVDDVLTGRQYTSRGNTVSALWNTYLRAIEVELQALEQEELVGRLEELEEQTMRQEEGRKKWG